MKCDIYGGTGSDEDNRITVGADKKVSNIAEMESYC